MGFALALRSGSCPVGFVKCFGFVFFKFDGFHHLAKHAVAAHNDGGAVLIGQVEAQVNQVDHFLDGGRCQGEGAIVAVSAAACGLEIVRLRRLNGAEARAAAHHVDDHAGQFASGDVADAFLHKGNTGGRGAGGDAGAGAGRAVEHVNSCNFRFGLKESSADFRQFSC